MARKQEVNPITDLLKENRRKKRYKRLKRFGCLLLFICFVYYLFSDLSKINSIEIEGNYFISSEAILEASELVENQSYDFFSLSNNIISNVEQLDGISEVDISRNYRGSLVINIVEESVIASHEYSKNIALILNDGCVVYVEDDILNYGNYPILNNFDENRLIEFATEFALIPSQVRNLISDIAYKPESADETRCEFYMDDGKIVIVRIEDMAGQLAGDNYAKMIRMMPDNKYYDLMGKYSYIFD